MAYTDIDDPTAYFQTTLYAGNGSADHSITNSGNSDLQPDWVWIKNRAATDVHCLFDSVRGVTKLLTTVGDILETTDTDTLDAFNADGFRVDADVKVNTNAENYVSWQWKAGTTGSGTTTGAGTGKAYSYSVNTTSGFSIVKYGGNGTAAHTIPHHLGVAPAMVICKSITQNRGWPVQHQSLTDASYSLYLSTTAAQASGTNSWNSTAASSSVVTLGNDANNNRVDSNDQYIMYSFAEKQGYSKFGSYVGNGNADGTFIYTGFKPAFLLWKLTNAAGYGFQLVDSKRNTFNPVNSLLFPYGTHVEYTNASEDLDLLSNGFKFRNSDRGRNGSGDTYIYMAFAENPFVTSTGVPATAR
jgi:hypothetical protein